MRLQALHQKIFAMMVSCVFLACFCELAAAQEIKSALPESIARANALTDLSAIGSYQLHAHIIVDPRSAREQQGEITIYRDHNRSRLELQLGDFRQVEIISAGTRYVWRSQQYPMIGLQTLEGLEHVVQMRTVFPWNTKFSQGRKQMVKGVAAVCFEAKGPYTGKMRFCFDQQRGTVLEASDHFGWRGRFLDYAAAGTSLFPTRIEFKEDVAPRHAELNEIRVSGRKFDDASFAIPPGAHAFTMCGTTTRALPVTGTEWNIPLRQKGQVYLYAIVDADGSAHNITAYGTKNKRLQQEVNKLALQWNFVPARCGRTSVASEILLPLMRAYSVDWGAGSPSSDDPRNNLSSFDYFRLPPSPEQVQDQTPSK